MAFHIIPKSELIERRFREHKLRSQGLNLTTIAARFGIDKKQVARDVMWVEQFNPWIDAWADTMANRYDLEPQDCRDMLVNVVKDFDL